MTERIRYFHFVWHLLVLAGTACHVRASHRLTRTLRAQVQQFSFKVVYALEQPQR